MNGLEHDQVMARCAGTLEQSEREVLLFSWRALRCMQVCSPPTPPRTTDGLDASKHQRGA
jgi:hypothetical protein